MKANQFSQREEAQVGIGTMIVFIATILVAAVAAGVLIDTSQKLQDKSTQTGTEATQDVGTSLEVLHIFGERDQLSHANAADPDEGIDLLKIQVRLAPGATSIDLSKVAIVYDPGTSAGYQELFYVSAADGAATNDFTATAISGTLSGTVMGEGDIVELQIGATDVDNAGANNQLNLGVKSTLKLSILPPTGNEVTKTISTPNTYANDKVFELF